MSDNELNVKFGADISDFSSKTDVISEKSRGYAKDLTDAINATNLASSSAVSGLGKVATATETVNFATAQATREYIVLGREVMTGNFSRIPGSLLVLANRLGGLQGFMSAITPATLAWAGAIGVVTYGLYEWTVSTEHAAEAQETISAALDVTNQGAGYTSDQIDILTARLRMLADVDSDTATKIMTAFIRAGYSGDELNRKIAEVGDFATAAGLDADKAAQEIVKIFSDPAKGAEQLAAKMPALISEQEAYHVAQTQSKEGEKKAAEELQSIIGPRLDDFRINHLTPLQKAYEDLTNRLLIYRKEIGMSQSEAQAFQKGLQSPAAPDNSAQKHQNDLNKAEADGLLVLQHVHGTHMHIIELQKQEAELAHALSAAQEKGDQDLSRKYQQGLSQVKENLVKAEKEANAQAVSEQLQIAREEISTKKQLADIALQQKRSELEAEVALGRVSKQQEIAQLQQYAQQEYQIELQALQKEEQLHGLSLVDKKRLDDQKLVLEAKFQAQRAQLARQAQQQEMTSYTQLSSFVHSTMGGMLSGVLQGTQTLSQAAASAFANMAASAIESIAEIIAEWLIFEVVTEGQGTWSDFMTLNGGKGSGGFGGFIGNKLFGHDVGDYSVPATGIAMIHQGEMIIPAPQAQAIRNGASLGGAPNITMHVNAVDAKSFMTFFNQPSVLRSVAKNLGAYMANNPSARPAY